MFYKTNVNDENITMSLRRYVLFKDVFIKVLQVNGLPDTPLFFVMQGILVLSFPFLKLHLSATYQANRNFFRNL